VPVELAVEEPLPPVEGDGGALTDALLNLLARAGGRVPSRERILEAVRGPGHHGSLRTVDNFIAQLRSKLEDDPANPALIEMVRGFGYRLAVS